MTEVVFKGKKYLVEDPISGISLCQVIKYVKALSPDTDFAMTPQMDQAASYHFKNICEELPAQYFTERGIRGVGIEDMIELFTQIVTIYNKERDGIDAAVENAEIAALREEISRLRQKEGK